VDGRWIDLDPSLADSEPGLAIAAIDRTLEQLPDDRFQHVSIRVVAEHLVDGAVVASTRLEVTRKSVDLIDTQILVFFERPMAATGIGSAIANALGQSIGDHWAPLFWIGGEFTFGAAVNAAAGNFVGEWLEFELAWPDGRREVTRRALVDRGGAAWRAAAQPDGSALRPVARDENGALAMQAVHNLWLSAGGHHLADFADASRMLLLDEAATTAGSGSTASPVGTYTPGTGTTVSAPTTTSSPLTSPTADVGTKSPAGTSTSVTLPGGSTVGERYSPGTSTEVTDPRIVFDIRNVQVTTGMEGAVIRFEAARRRDRTRARTRPPASSACWRSG
jgi:hypothetical protein